MKHKKTPLTLKERNTIMATLILISAAVVITGIILIQKAVSIATTSATDAFSEALDNQREETYQHFYQTSFDIAEEKNHVANEVTITVEEVRKESKLEVLQVSDIEYVYNEGNTKIWTAIRGHGVYTVDLSLSEFIVDNDRQYVLARVPRPQLDTAGLDYEYKNYLFENGIFNGNISKGVSFAQKDLEKAQKQLKEKLTSTQSYYECAQKSAEEIIINLVKNLNPEATELTVELEFID